MTLLARIRHSPTIGSKSAGIIHVLYAEWAKQVCVRYTWKNKFRHTVKKPQIIGHGPTEVRYARQTNGIVLSDIAIRPEFSIV